MLIAIVMLVFISGSLLIIATVMELQTRKQMTQRFTNMFPVRQNDDISSQVKGSLKERFLIPLYLKATKYIERLTPAATIRSVSRQIERAGNPLGLTAATWSLLRFSSLFGGAITTLFIWHQVPLPGGIKLIACLSCFAAGMIGPGIWLDGKIRERQWQIRRSLPDMIDLLVVSVEAGLGLDASCQEVVNRRRGPLMNELERVLAEIRVGRNRRQAWQDMASRVDVLEMKVFVAALVQAEELGASVAGVLKTQAEAIRVRRSLTVREVAAALPVKMLFPLIFFIFPSMFVVILGPGMINLAATFSEIGF